MTKRQIGLLLLAQLMMSSTIPAREGPAYKDPEKSIEHRVSDLLYRMTLEEKVAQLLSLWEDKGLLLGGVIWNR